MPSDEWYSEWFEKRNSAKKSLARQLNRLKKLNSKSLNAKANAAHADVFNRIDCLDCANCCKSIPPIVNETDSRRISRYLGMKVSEFKAQYTREDDDGDSVMNTSPCPFLGEDNKCDIYDIRPKACRKYPHTGEFEFARHMKLHKINVAYCPAGIPYSQGTGECNVEPRQQTVDTLPRIATEYVFPASYRYWQAPYYQLIM